MASRSKTSRRSTKAAMSAAKPHRPRATGIAAVGPVISCELETRVSAIEAKITNSKHAEWAATVDARFLDITRLLIELQRQVGIQQSCFGAIGGLLANVDGAVK